MSWRPPTVGGPSEHLIPVGWWEGHPDLPEPHTGNALEDWFSVNHKCVRCGRVIRSHQHASQPCKATKEANDASR
jgi:hypothetical protein